MRSRTWSLEISATTSMGRLKEWCPVSPTPTVDLGAGMREPAVLFITLSWMSEISTIKNRQCLQREAGAQEKLVTVGRPRRLACVPGSCWGAEPIPWQGKDTRVCTLRHLPPAHPQRRTWARSPAGMLPPRVPASCAWLSATSGKATWHLSRTHRQPVSRYSSPRVSALRPQ